MKGVVATAKVIARPADFEIGTGAPSVGPLSHMLTVMCKYKNAASIATTDIETSPQQNLKVR
jgi:tetrahydromethanopterin S-methyltransferase subunit C